MQNSTVKSYIILRTEDLSQLADGLLRMHKALSLTPRNYRVSWHMPVIPAPKKLEAEGSEVQRHLRLDCEMQTLSKNKNTNQIKPKPSSSRLKRVPDLIRQESVTDRDQQFPGCPVAGLRQPIPPVSSAPPSYIKRNHRTV